LNTELLWKYKYCKWKHTGFRFLTGAGGFPLHHSVHTSPGAQSAFYPMNSFIHHWLYSSLLDPGLSFCFVIFLAETVGLLGRVISPSQGRYLHTGQHKPRIKAHTDIRAVSGIRTYDPSVRACKDSSCLRRAVTVIGLSNEYRGHFPNINRPENKADHSSLSSAEVKDARSCTSSLP
jgi:hypothetical protein